MNTEKVTRFEVIDHRPCDECGGRGQLENGNACIECEGNGCPGRSVVCWDYDAKIDVQLQDDDRTLKVFISEG